MYFLLLMLFPVIWVLAARLIFKTSICWRESGISLFVTALLVGGVYMGGMYGQTADHEFWNGEVTEKVRHHDTYEQAYKCMCTTDSDGNESCMTCYETHYTVDWYLKTTIGKINLDSEDSTRRAVYNEPDPRQYKNAVVGEGCSKTTHYVNYIKAVPESLFNDSDVQIDEQFVSMIPEYPKLRAYYKVDRVLPVGVTVPNISNWNITLTEHLKKIGPAKQANIIIVLANTTDHNYRYALERAWLGGKKNDVIVILGTPNFPTIEWVETITLGANMGNELMTIKMHERVMALKTADINVVDTIAGVVTDHFDRKAMEDYAYLEDEIEPPMWSILVALVLALLSQGFLTYYFHNNRTFR